MKLHLSLLILLITHAIALDAPYEFYGTISDDQLLFGTAGSLLFDPKADSYNSVSSTGTGDLSITGTNNTFGGFGGLSIGGSGVNVNFDFELQENVLYFWANETEFDVTGVLVIDLESQHAFYLYRILAKMDMANMSVSWGGQLGYDGCVPGAWGTADGVMDEPAVFPDESWFTASPGDSCEQNVDLVGWSVYLTDNLVSSGYSTFDETPYDWSSSSMFFGDVVDYDAGQTRVLAYGVSLEFLNRNLTAFTDLHGDTTTTYKTIELNGYVEAAKAYFDWQCGDNTYGTVFFCKACKCVGAETCDSSDGCICDNVLYNEDCSACIDSRTGDDCTDCVNGYFEDGEECTICPECVNGECVLSGINAGTCSCDDDWTGDLCSEEIPTDIDEELSEQMSDISMGEISSEVNEQSEDNTEQNFGNSMMVTPLFILFLTIN